MRTLLQRPVQIARVAEDGRIHCPVRTRTVSWKLCQGCQFLTTPVYDEAGEMMQLVCSPTIRALLPTED
jgi:hypothetical protein